MNITQYIMQHAPSRATTGPQPPIAPAALAWLLQAVAAETPAVLVELLELYLQDSAKLVAMLLATAGEKSSGVPTPGRDPLALRLTEPCRALEQPSPQGETPVEFHGQVQAIVREYARVQVAIGKTMEQRQRPQRQIGQCAPGHGGPDRRFHHLPV